jgi:hypothetical protein
MQDYHRSLEAVAEPTAVEKPASLASLVAEVSAWSHGCKPRRKRLREAVPAQPGILEDTTFGTYDVVPMADALAWSSLARRFVLLKPHHHLALFTRASLSSPLGGIAFLVLCVTVCVGISCLFGGGCCTLFAQSFVFAGAVAA